MIGLKPYAANKGSGNYYNLTLAPSQLRCDFMGYCSRGIVLNDIVLEKLKNIFNSTANIAEGLNRHGVWT